jgi:hypothetical protein
MSEFSLDSVGRFVMFVRGTYENMIPEIQHLVFFRGRGEVWTAVFFLPYADRK